MKSSQSVRLICSSTPQLLLGCYESLFPFSVAQEQSVRIKKIILHPQYEKDSGRNDIALLVLKKRLKLGKEVQAACLPTSRVVEAGCYATGWGDTEFNGTQPTTLQKIKVCFIQSFSCLSRGQS